MEKKVIAIEETVHYIAKDGTEFCSPYRCEEYENFLDIGADKIRSEMQFFNYNDKIKEFTKIDKPEGFCMGIYQYALITDTNYENYRKFLHEADHSVNDYYRGLEDKGLYVYCASGMSGSDQAYDGWFKICDKLIYKDITTFIQFMGDSFFK